MKEIKTIRLNIKGMTCNEYADHVRRALERVEGVIEVNVPGWRSGEAVVRMSKEASTDAILNTVKAAGYNVRLHDPDSPGVAASVSGAGSKPERDKSGKASEKERSTLSERSDASPSAGLSEAPRSRNNAGDRYDWRIIGGGSAGFAASIRGAELGFLVALVEMGTIGGNCVNRGCVPSKTLIRAVEKYHRTNVNDFPGVYTSAERLEWGEIITRKDELVARLRKSKYLDVLAAYPSIKLIRGEAHLPGETLLRLMVRYMGLKRSSLPPEPAHGHHQYPDLQTPDISTAPSEKN